MSTEVGIVFIPTSPNHAQVKTRKCQELFSLTTIQQPSTADRTAEMDSSHATCSLYGSLFDHLSVPWAYQVPSFFKASITLLLAPGMFFSSLFAWLVLYPHSSLSSNVTFLAGPPYLPCHSISEADKLCTGGYIWTSTCVCMTRELKMILTFFNGWKNQEKKNILWCIKLHKIRISVPIN